MPRKLIGLSMPFLLVSLMTGELIHAQVPVTTRSRDDFSPHKPASAKKAATKPTVIEFELLQGTDGSGLHSQQWLKVLEPLDVSLRIHRASSIDKPDVTERELGNTRYVKAVGTLDRGGQISFPGRSFNLNEPAKLKEWIEELRTYGIQGSPTGQPLWGLTKDQFEQLYEGLLNRHDAETEDVRLSDVISKLPIPAQYPISWSPEAKEKLAKRGDKAKSRQELKGFSVATVLAVSLAENGLAFRPNRLPSGQIQLLIELKSSKIEQWPVGWPVQQRGTKAAPKLNSMVPVELSDVELSDVINAIAQLSDTPILIDYSELDAKQIDLSKIKVSFPRKMTTWSIALGNLVVPHKLTRELWQDEAGRVFVWITTTRAGRSKEAEK